MFIILSHPKKVSVVITQVDSRKGDYRGKEDLTSERPLLKDQSDSGRSQINGTK